MADIHVAEDRRSAGMLPEGILERWFVADGVFVRAGEAVAAVRIGEALHDIVSPASGRLEVLAAANAIVDRGCIIAEVHL
ncbi:biotin/lipoyl-containing protein [Methylobacterium sp. PvR107]|uniref:biotin/lipoyl-containing protein n=1 Tax=Methylobacterium sp. PvR107 TaxID=2806597 RepID=UPI001AE1D831|nr:biotin/lipoyl-containing protein [Methylobacterium sp. PvR107]MBP1179889.1 biotin carboxyl carrier protein [Methylobacterium sp. PvR107]